jgi:mannan endo-1,4-beta-mannosidase
VVRRGIEDWQTAVPAESDGLGRHRGAPSRVRNLAGGSGARPAVNRGLDDARPLRHARRKPRRKPARRVTVTVATITAVMIALIIGLYVRSVVGRSPTPRSYLGIYTAGLPESYTGVSAFTAATGVRPGLVMYYSGWLERFQTAFAREAARHDAEPLVQIEPTGISLAAIASGRYDAYLRSYASAVKAFGSQVILSFGHEMNGSWYSWGYQHTSPAAFVAAWRHVVTVFRAVGARNVTWLWTVNIVRCRCHIDSPAAWWPGSSYVNWVGIDGYYYQQSWKFAALFGSTIKAVRALTLDPILISETAAPTASQPAKIADLFAGIRAYGLLGFVWFDHNKSQEWSISSQRAFAAFRRGAESYRPPR